MTIALVVYTTLAVLCIAAFFGLVKRKPSASEPRVELSLLFLSASVMIISIAAIEYLIRVNNLSGVNDVESVGQLIALLGGAFTLGNTIWETWEMRCDEPRFYERDYQLFGWKIT